MKKIILITALALGLMSCDKDDVSPYLNNYVVKCLVGQVDIRVNYGAGEMSTTILSNGEQLVSKAQDSGVHFFTLKCRGGGCIYTVDGVEYRNESVRIQVKYVEQQYLLGRLSSASSGVGLSLFYSPCSLHSPCLLRSLSSGRVA